MERNSIICGDCLLKLKDFPDSSIDLVVTSPPYDNLRDYKGYSFDFENIAQELFRVIKDGGVIVWVVGDATINGSETGTSFKQALYFKKIGFKLHDTMIFKKMNYVPTNHKRYEQEFEYMFVLLKGDIKTFNPFKRPNKLAGKVYNTKRPREYDNFAFRTNEDRNLIYKDFSIKGNVFSYSVGIDNNKTGHPAAFPEKLAEDHILSWSNEGDLVLDPFCGSGTTLKMAKKNKRDYVGIDISKEYCEIGEKRMNEIIKDIKEKEKQKSLFSFK